MKRRERQGHRQLEEAQILVGWKAPPDTPHPSVLKAPVSPGRGFFICSDCELSGSAVHVAKRGAGHTAALARRGSKERMGNCSCPIRGNPDRALS
jgi:hypothetical protein